MKRLFSRYALAMLVMLGASGIAHAADYSGSCAGVSGWGGMGNATIGSSGTACTISSAVTATGSITVLGSTVSTQQLTAGGNLSITGTGTVTTKDLNAAGYVDVESTGDITTTGTVTASGSYTNYAPSTSNDATITGTVSSYSYVQILANNINTKDISVTNDGNILLVAQTNLATGNLSNVNGYNIDLKANQGGSSSLFEIGGSSVSNGVNGTISAQPNGTDPTFATTCVYITNGQDDSAGGGIKLDSGGAITVNLSGNRSGYIILNAQDDTLTMPGGTLSADGAGSDGAGDIILNAHEIDFADNAVVSASQGSGASGTYHGVVLAAETVTFGGGSGLEIHADGDGYAMYEGAFAQLLPEGANTITDGEDVTDLYIYVSTSPYVSGSIDYEGSDDAPLTVTANGSHGYAQASGYPVSFSGGDLTMTSNGASDHTVNIQNPGTLTGTTGATFGNSGDILIQALGVSGDGGTIQFYLDQVSITGDSFTVNANGPTSGNGNGGTIWLSSSELTLDDGTTAAVSANAASSGTGNAVNNSVNPAIYFYPGDADFDIGTDAGQWSFAATGGSTSGNSGYILLGGYSSAVEIFGAGAMTTSVNVSVPGSTGTGGVIDLTAYEGLTFDGSTSILQANGGSTSGDGGSVLIATSTEAVTIGSGSGYVALAATAPGSGNGGTVSVTDYSGITADSASIAVNGGSTGNGGNLTLNSDYATLTLNSAEFHADGGASGGNGGFILLEGGEIELVAEENTLVTANSLSDGGNGGTVEVTTNSAYGSVDFGSDNGQVTIEANGADGSGSGGNLQVIQAKSYTVHDGDSLSAIAYDNGDGGYIILQCTDTITVDGTVNAKGLGTGNGGTISLQAPTIAVGGSASFNADAGYDGNGNGGVIALRNGDGMTPLDLSTRYSSVFSAQGNGTGEGGHLTIESVGPFEFQTVLNVNGGSDVTSGATPYGVVTLNGVAAGQWVTNFGSYPNTYWKTIAPYTSPDATVAGYANGLAAGALTVLSSTTPTPVQLFWMDSVTEYNTFFADTISTNDLGDSDTDPGEQVSAVYNNVHGDSVQSVVDNTGPALAGVTAHELGHQVDAIEGTALTPPLVSLQTGTGSFGAALSADFTTINGLTCTDVLPSVACSYSLPNNSEKLLAYINVDPTFATPDEDTKELFADLFAYLKYPMTDFALYEHAYSYLTNTNAWMSTYVGSLP